MDIMSNMTNTMNTLTYTLTTIAVCLLLGSGISAAQESTVYATTIKTGIFVVGSQTPPAGVFFQHSSSDDTVWKHAGPPHTRGFSADIPAAMHGNTLYVASGNGLHKVDERSGTWRTVTDWRMTEVLDVTSAPSDPNTIYIATAYGVWRSHDGGTTWDESVPTSPRPGFASKVIVDNAHEQRLYCASYEGLFVSDDGAVTWKKMEGLTIHGILVIRQHPSSPNILVAGTEDNGMYLSTDGGVVWKKCEAGIDHSTFYAIAFDPQQPEIMYAGGYVTGVYKSINGGASWRRMNEGLNDLNIHAIAVDPLKSDRVYAATFSDGVYRTDDGGATWHRAGLTGAQVWDVKILKW
jgi:photosystem II stability/assembly factor-like uncharacterized protein